MMPPCQRRQQPLTIQLSWLTAQRRWATSRHDSDDYDCRRLEAFRHQLQLHEIPYWGASFRVFVRRHYSGSYHSTTLCQLVELNYVPRRVRVPIPADYFPHECTFCPDTDGVQPPFRYVPCKLRARGRPRRDEASRQNLEEESLGNESMGVGRGNRDSWPSSCQLEPGEY
jgi:hypothetical protein